jgi:hypothetical protein
MAPDAVTKVSVYPSNGRRGSLPFLTADPEKYFSEFGWLSPINKE